MHVSLESFEHATDRLEEAIVRLRECPADEMVRDSVIKRFEFTYELSHRVLRRFLSLTEPNPEEVAEMTFPQLIRTGNQRHLLMSDWTRWHRFRDLRNKTAHPYNESMAIEVSEGAPAFLDEARFLLRAIEARQQETR